MNDIIFFIDSYKREHKSLYVLSFIYFLIGLISPLFLLSIFNDNKLLIISFVYLVVTLISSYYFYILKDYTIIFYTNGETIYETKKSFLDDNYKVSVNENVDELINGYTNILRKILSNKFEIEKITKRFIFISYDDNKERKNIKILNAYSHLIQELGGKNEK